VALALFSGIGGLGIASADPDPGTAPDSLQAP
jgi:hypothetical protein